MDGDLYGGEPFLADAARYMQAVTDDAFVAEIAYVMVTVHKSAT